MRSARDTQVPSTIVEEIEEQQQVREDTPVSQTADAIDTAAIEEPLDQIKQSDNEIIEILCREAGIAEPEIIHGPCPDMPGEKSCTKGVVGDNGKVVKSQIYFDPISASPRTILHEFKHHFELMTGDLERFKDEHETERWARKVLGERFPYDETPEENDSSNNMTQAANDTQIAQDMSSTFEDQYSYNPDNNRPLGMSSYEPSYFRYTPRLSESLKPRTETSVVVSEEPIVVPRRKSSKDDGGVVGLFDMMYPRELADIAGVSTQTLSDAATPEILGYSVNAVQDTVFSPLGSLLSSLVIGTTLFGAGAFAGPDQIAMRERRMLYETGSHFFFSWIRAVSPAQQQVLLQSAQQASQALGRLDLNGFVQTMLRNPSGAAKITAVPAQPVVAANNNNNNAPASQPAIRAVTAQDMNRSPAAQPQFTTRFSVSDGDAGGGVDRATAAGVGIYSGAGRNASNMTTSFACNYES